MEPMVNIALRAAWDAENLVNRMIDRPDLLRVTHADDGTYTTSLEHKVEETILSALRQAHPQHSYFTTASGLMQGSAGESDFHWIIDPLSGRDNLIRGIPHFAFSIACQHRGRTEHVVIVDPILRERFTASRGKGAQLNDSRIRVTGRKGLQDSALAAACGPQPSHASNARVLQAAGHARTQGATIRESGCVTLDLAYIAAGRLDGGWMSGFGEIELLAGTMLVAEAGGLASDFEGGESWQESGNLVTASPKCLKPLLQLIRNAP